MKLAIKFDVSAYKLVRMSEVIKKKRGPYQLQKSRLTGTGNSGGYFVWDLTHYNDEKLVGTRVITHYFVKPRSLMFK